MCNNVAAAVAACQPDIANERIYFLEFGQRRKEEKPLSGSWELLTAAKLQSYFQDLESRSAGC